MERLAELWANIKKSNHNEMTSRGFESIYRIAEAFARLMLKTIIDSEVVEQTISYISNMYHTYGSEIAEPPEYRTLSWLEIAKVVKDHALGQFWTEGQDEQLEELRHITFNAAAEQAASKNETVRTYIGENFRSGNNKPVRHLKEMFREERKFDGGRIKVVSKDKYAELKLTWVPNAVTIEETTARKVDKN
jgi:DNA replicative helicase MCM subunit Mcm2 (Cdc46/Mcm family)